jgi:serine-type D-Ala-D-Ala carboxypeptidase/endopeptidase
MRDTAITLSPALRARFVLGHDGQHRPAPAWDMDALAGCGALHSTATDMLTYLEAELHPDHLPPGAATTAAGKTLGAAIRASQVSRGEAKDGMHIALNWLLVDESGTYWHNGATGGYSAFAAFNPGRDFAVIVLSNTSIGDRAFADDLGTHVAQRLSGKPAISLAPIPE